MTAAIDPKVLANLRAAFAMRGHELTEVTKGELTYYEVRRWGQSRMFSTAHDLRGFLNQIGGAA